MDGLVSPSRPPKQKGDRGPSLSSSTLSAGRRKRSRGRPRGQPDEKLSTTRTISGRPFRPPATRGTQPSTGGVRWVVASDRGDCHRGPLSRQLPRHVEDPELN